MTIRSRRQPSVLRIRATALAAFAFVFLTVNPWFRAAAQGPGNAAPGDDLNLLLRLLSQDVRLGLVEIARPIDPLWIKDIRGLQSSSSAAVAATARAVEESAKMREEALKILEEVKEKNEKLRQENPVDIGDAVSGLLPDGVSDEDIEAAYRSGKITRSEAEAYRGRRNAQDNALMTLGKVALLSYANEYLPNIKVRQMRREAEVLEADAAAEHLVPALRARAGAKRDDPPLRIVAGFGADPRQAVRLLITIFSTSDEPLTQFTLLTEIRSAAGRRRAVAYIPRLEPGRGVQVAPVPYALWIEPRPGEGKQKDPANGIRHSVWCDQFAFEGEEVAFTPSKVAKAAYCAVVAEKGRGYAFDNLGALSNNRDRTSYRLEFSELTPVKDTYHVKGKLGFYQSRDDDKPSQVTPFDGAFRGVDPPSSSATNSSGTKSTGTKASRKAAQEPAAFVSADAHLTLGTGKTKSEIDFYIMENGRVEWIPRTGPLQRRMIRTVEEAREAHDLRADMLRHNKVLGGARNLARAGKKEEAAKALEEYIATNPGDDNVAQARSVLGELDTLAAEGPPVRDARGPRGNSPKKPGMTNPRSRPGSKP